MTLLTNKIRMEEVNGLKEGRSQSLLPSLRKIWNLRKLSKKPILAINNNVQYGLSWIKLNLTRPCYNNVLSFRKRFCRLFTKKKTQILMVGLRGAGKSEILYKLKLWDSVFTDPSTGFVVQTLKYKNHSLSVWDVGGQDKIQPLWRHYFQNIKAVIFVIDSSDRNRNHVVEARDELHRMMNEDELRDAVLLVLANKKDLPNAMSAAQITNLLRLHSLSLQCRHWFVQSTSATSGEGLYEGLRRLDHYILRGPYDYRYH